MILDELKRPVMGALHFEQKDAHGKQFTVMVRDEKIHRKEMQLMHLMHELR